MKKTNNVIYILLTIFGATTLVFLGLFISYLVTSRNYETQLENTYKKNFYEVVSNINDIEMDMSKVVATTDKDSQRELLMGIYNTAMIGTNNINLLPITYSKMSNINNLLNKTSGYVYSLILSINNGNNIDSEDYEQISSLHSSFQDIQYDLNEYMSNIAYDYNILDDIEFDNYESEDFSAGIINTESSNSKLPTLIYDGPFSDSVLNKEIIGLGDIEYSYEDILERARKIFGNMTIEYAGESKGKFNTYNFRVYSDFRDLYVSFTSRGGFLLTITSFGSDQDNQENNYDGIEIAESFAREVGISDMHCVWSQTTGNVMYVNLAPIVNKVIYYSDLIKVKVDLSSGEVIGWEATNYATNHKARKFTSSLSILDAEKNISSILKIEERNFTIIPDKYVGEICAYEYICTWKNYTYYIFLDANTGKECNILRVLSTTNGDLLV